MSEVITQVEEKEPVQVEAEAVVESKEPEVKEPEAKEGEEKDPKDQKEPEPEPKKENHFERRQRRLLQERAEYKAKAELLEQMMNQQKQEKVDGRPARDKYENDEDYVDALTDWKVSQKLTGIEERIAQTQLQAQTQNSWGQKINQARTDYPDYDEVMETAQDIPITKHVAEAMQSSDIGADIAYYLAKNPAEADKINTLGPMAAAREIGRIESYIEYERGQKKAPVKTSKAPAPIKPVKPSTASSGKSLEDMSPAEYMAYRNKQEMEKHKRGRF